MCLRLSPIMRLVNTAQVYVAPPPNIDSLKWRPIGWGEIFWYGLAARAADSTRENHPKTIYIYKDWQGVWGRGVETGWLWSADPVCVWAEIRVSTTILLNCYRHGLLSAHTVGSADPSGQYLAVDDLILCPSLLFLIYRKTPHILPYTTRFPSAFKNVFKGHPKHCGESAIRIMYISPLLPPLRQKYPKQLCQPF